MRARILLVLCVAGCQGTSGGDLDRPDAGEVEESDGDPGGGRVLLGSLKVAEVHAPYGDSGVVQGALWPSAFAGFHTEVMNDGTCRLLTYEPGFCEPVCQEGLCLGGVCQDYPVTDAGLLTVSGLEEEVVVEPQPYPFGGYGYWTVIERSELFAGGDQIGVSAPGGDFPAFEVAAGGVDDLELGLENDEIQMPNGREHTFSWPASPEGEERLRLTLNANNEFHGAPYLAIIECDAAASDGAITIPREMVEAFPATEHWDGCAGSDCPPSHAMLYQRGVVGVGDGEVELLVGSEVLFFLVHPAADGTASLR